MNKIILNIIRLICLVIVACFFFSYFVISCMGEEANISGKDAAFGFDMGNNIKSDPSPVFIFIPGVALVVLVVMGIPSKKNEFDTSKKKISGKNYIPIIGSIIGLVLLIIVYNKSIGEVKKQIGVRDISEVFRTGIGFRASVVAYIFMFVLPFVDMILIKLKSSPQNYGQTDLKR
ncbi:hypothetical protein FACS1894172_15480 [Spirochaetia bacterium]|nr:hypothetical protein FACS1894172_15480 [Spirochaetia bacterium]